MKSARIVVCLSPLALTIALVAACAEDLPASGPCHDIPSGGCPRRDDACQDPSCAAVYFCTAEGAWALDHTCPAHDASAPEAAPVADASPIRDAFTGVPGAFGGPGCEDLIAPDCSLGAALACGQGCCGCEDLYVCESGGWNLWGACSGGAITSTPRDH